MFDIKFPTRGHCFNEDEVSAVSHFMRQSHLKMTQGSHRDHFETQFSKKFSLGDALALSNAASGFHLLSDLLQIDSRSEIVCPAHTYCASVYPFLKYRPKIVWADINPKTRVAEAPDLIEKITTKTKIVIAVHLYGYMIDLSEVRAECDQKGIILIEDCAQCIGANIDGVYAGHMGDYSLFSFQSQKNMSTLGEGGMLVVNSRQKKQLGNLERCRHNGHEPFKNQAVYWKPAMTNVVPTYNDGRIVYPQNYCLSEVQCLVGDMLLKRIDDLSETRRNLALEIINQTKGNNNFEFHFEPSNRHVYHLLVARAFDKKTRDKLITEFNNNGVQAITQYYPLYKYEIFSALDTTAYHLPNTEDFFDRMISLPFSLSMDRQTVEKLASIITKVASITL